MKKIVIYFFLFSATLTGYANNKSSCLTLLDATKDNIIRYAHCHWSIVPPPPALDGRISDVEETKYDLTLNLLNPTEKKLVKVINTISNELGQYTYNHNTLPTNMNDTNCVVDMVYGVMDYGLADGGAFYWWVTDGYIVRLFTFQDPQTPKIIYANLTIFDLKKLSKWCEGVIINMYKTLEK